MGVDDHCSPSLSTALRARLLVLFWCACLYVCARAKGKEKREESVAYHRQRAALDRLQEKHNLASFRAREAENEGAFTRRADRECACPREKETRRARLKLECPLECCWVVCTGWFSNRRRIERIKREGMRETRSLTDAREMLHVFRLIDHCTYFEFHLPQNFSITYLVSSIISHFAVRLFLLHRYVSFSRFSWNLFQAECVARSSTNRNDASSRERLLFTQLSRLSRVWGWERAHAAIYLRESGLF